MTLLQAADRSWATNLRKAMFHPAAFRAFCARDRRTHSLPVPSRPGQGP